MMNDFVTFDVIGTKFRLRKSTLKKFPNSVLATVGQSQRTDLPQSIIKTGPDEYFIERSADMFKIVVDFCFTGTVHCPTSVCQENLLDEFIFWELLPSNSCKVCVPNFEQDYEERMQIVDLVHWTDHGRRETLKHKLWDILEHPSISIAAMVFNAISMIFIITSILNIIFASIPDMQFCEENGRQDNFTVGPKSNYKCIGAYIFYIIEATCIVWFTLELGLRLVASESLKTYFTTPMIIIDILAVLPFYIELILFLCKLDDDDESMSKAKGILVILRMLRIFRIFRIFKLARYLTSLRVLGETIVSARKELNMLLVFILITSIIFSNCLYQLEKQEDGTAFSSIPAAFWWCIVTLTTVGYGDMFPQTVLGKIFGGITCICGIIVVAFPIAILVEKFMDAYKKHEKHSSKILSKKISNEF